MNLNKQLVELTKLGSVQQVELDKLKVGNIYVFRNLLMNCLYIGELSEISKIVSKNKSYFKYKIKFKSVTTIEQLIPTFSGSDTTLCKEICIFTLTSYKFYELNYTKYNKLKSEIV